MYQPGLDRQLAQIRYAEFLEEAARERADRKARNVQKAPAARQRWMAAAAIAPILVWVLLKLVAA